MLLVLHFTLVRIRGQKLRNSVNFVEASRHKHANVPYLLQLIHP